MIAEALRRYVAYQEQIDLLKKRLINASIYPAVLLVAVTAQLGGRVVPGSVSEYGYAEVRARGHTKLFDGLEDNLCRCGAHIRIVKAIQAAAKEMKGGK